MSQYEIPINEAITLTTTYRNNHPDKTRAFKIDKAEIEEIFANSEAISIRSYLGEDATGLRLIMVGVNSSGKDILTTCFDHTVTCPEVCDETSELNIGE